MPPTGAIWSVDPSGKVICTELTSSPTSTATHHTGSPSTTPKVPVTSPRGSLDGLVVVGVVVGEGTGPAEVVAGVGTGAFGPWAGDPGLDPG